MDIEKLKFPIGKYTANKNPDEQTLQRWINDIERFPSSVEQITKEASAE